MLGGYNHNIRYRDRVYHVQTEDLGLQAARIRTHIFFNGAVVAETQQTYAELLHQPMAPQQRETYIRARMQALHKDAMKKLTEGKLDALIFRLPHPAQGAPGSQLPQHNPGQAHTRQNQVHPQSTGRPAGAPSSVPGPAHPGSHGQAVGQPTNVPNPSYTHQVQQLSATQNPQPTSQPPAHKAASNSSVPPAAAEEAPTSQPPEDIPGRAQRLFPKKEKKAESMSAEERMIQAKISRSESSIVKNRKPQVSDEDKEKNDKEKSSRAARSRNTVKPYKVPEGE